jgi:hypothetical protein
MPFPPSTEVAQGQSSAQTIPGTTHQNSPNNHHLVLLTPEETKRLNKINRTEMTPTRLEDAGIILYSESAVFEK